MDEFKRFMGFSYNMQKTEDTKTFTDTEHLAIPFPSKLHNSQHRINRCILNFVKQSFFTEKKSLSDTISNLKDSFFIPYFFIQYYSLFKMPDVQNVQLLKNNLDNHIIQSIQSVSYNR